MGRRRSGSDVPGPGLTGKHGDGNDDCSRGRRGAAADYPQSATPVTEPHYFSWGHRPCTIGSLLSYAAEFVVKLRHWAPPVRCPA